MKNCSLFLIGFVFMSLTIILGQFKTQASDVVAYTTEDVVSTTNEDTIITEDVVEEVNVETDNNVYTPWKLVAEDVVATVYNAVPGQCDSTPNLTASGFKLDLNNVEGHRVIAMERTFRAALGLKYGDVVKIEGCGKYDGVWQIQDVMNKRFAGQHKIDLLVDRSVRLGKWTNVKMYVLNDKSLTDIFKKDMLPSL